MEIIHTLTKSQKNRVFREIVNMGIDPIHFDWHTIEEDNRVQYSLVLKNDVYCYLFESYEDDLYVSYYYNLLKKQEEHISFPDWDEQIEDFVKWLIMIKPEVNEPDLWADMLKYQSQLSFSVPATGRNEKISYTEYEDIEDRVVRFFEAIKKQYDLTQEEIKLLNHKQESVLNAAKSQKSQDWMYLVVGVFMTIVMGIPSIQQDMETFKRLIEEFFGGIIHLLGQ